MKLNNFWFGFLLSSSMHVVFLYFGYFAEMKSFSTFGFDMMVCMLPIAVVLWRMWAVAALKEQKKKHNEDMQSVILRKKR